MLGGIFLSTWPGAEPVPAPVAADWGEVSELEELADSYSMALIRQAA
jgi:hypothetical protein